MYRLLIKYDGEYQDLIIEGDGGLILETNDPLNYEFGKSNKTYSIIIPNTARNNLMLDNLFNKTFDYDIVFSDIFLQVFPNMLLGGKLIVNEITESDARCQFINANYDLIEDLKKNTLRDYSYGVSHTVTAANQILSESLSLNSGNVIYELLDRGMTLYHQNSPAASPNAFKHRLLVSERWPAYRLKKIIDTIFSGYTVGGNHFTNTLFSEKQYLLFNSDNVNISGDVDDWDRNLHVLELKFSEDQVEFLDLSGDSGFNHEILDTWDFDEVVTDDKAMHTTVPANEITILEDGVYRVEFKWAGVFRWADLPTITNNRAILYIKKNGTTIKTDTVSLPVKENSDQEYSYFISCGDIYLEEGDYLECQMNILGTIGTPEGNVGVEIITYAKDTYAYVGITTAIGEGYTLAMEDVMPNIKASDFIKAYCKEYGLQLLISAEKKEVLFFKQSSSDSIVDISTMIIPDTVTIKPNSERNNVLFTRKITDDKIAKTSDANTNNDYLLDIGEDATEVFESEFSTTHEEVISKFGYTGDMGQIWNEYDLRYPKKEPIWGANAGLRLLFDDGAKTCSYNLENSAGTTVARTSFRRLTPALSTFDSNFNGDLYDDYHADIWNNKIYGHTLECDLIVTDDFIGSLYYHAADRDWRCLFSITIPRYSGLYRIKRLERKEANVYKAVLYKDLR